MLNKFNTKLIMASLLLNVSLYGGTYDEKYSLHSEVNASSSENYNLLMHGDFKEIIRFDMLAYDGGRMDENSEKLLKNIIDTLHAYKADAKMVQVSILGHTQATTDDMNEKTIDSSNYANKIQNWFRSTLERDESKKLSKEYALDVQKAITDAGIDKNSTIVEYRRGDDLGFTDETQEGKELSNRVMVTLYVTSSTKMDSDKDGVSDAKDLCPNTPIGIKVDLNGCALDSDKDGVVDVDDKCPDTPIGVVVDTSGCALDSDSDGVVDYKDACPDTELGMKVDLSGCHVRKTLALTFETGSDEILSTSAEEIKTFATFMKNNPAYNAEIVGHTDSVGKDGDNMRLSLKRAQAAKTALIAAGVKEERLKVSGKGELDPIQSNRTKEGRDTNRRIEVKLSY
ncbi:MAG: OmpA family protein [Sulfurimonas sp.]|nr:OmpA family protein [Sulfurimonas sp.]